MEGPTQTSSDSWYNVTDPKERKKIQDRLAQRARRKRLAEGNPNKRVIRSKPRADLTERERRRHLNHTIDYRATAPISSPDSQSVFAALFQNGKILGLRCSTSFPAKSEPAHDGIPLTLRPTLLQISTVHFRWIDRFPMEDCRDEMILNMGSYEEEDFLRDLFTTTSFTIKPGFASWDPAGWSIEPEFQKNWGWLFPWFTKQSGNDFAIEL